MAGDQIRCFVALEIPTEVKCQLAEIQERDLLPQLSWVNPENMHLTLKFLGDVPKPEVFLIEESLTRIAIQNTPFVMQIGGLGAFPNFSRPKVIWAGVQKNGEKIISLAHQLNTILGQIGYPSEKRPFIPHITLARIHHPINLKNFAFDEFYEIPPITVNRISLMQSRLQPSGVVYTLLSSFEFKYKETE